MKKVLLSLLASGLFLLLNSCNQQQDTKTTTVVTTDSVNALKEITILNDSADSKWTQMMTADSIKFTDIKRLLEEISYCKKYDEKEFNRLMKMTSQVYASRYTQETLSDSLITLYDSTTTILINKVRNLKSNTPEILQHPLADQLENDILKSDNEDVILHRNHYDKAAIEFNSFLEQNKEAIEKEGQGKFKKKKLFSVVL